MATSRPSFAGRLLRGRVRNADEAVPPLPPPNPRGGRPISDGENLGMGSTATTAAPPPPQQVSNEEVAPSQVRAHELEKALQELKKPELLPLKEYMVYLKNGASFKVMAHTIDLAWRGPESHQDGHMYFFLVEYRSGERDSIMFMAKEDDVETIVPAGVEYNPKERSERRLS